MIRPKRFLIIGRTACRATRNAPVRLVAMTASQSSSLIRSSSVSRVMPAFATSTSTLPRAASTWANAASTWPGSVTSHDTPNTPVGTSPVRYVAATRWPARASRSAIPRPIPLLPPVTRTTREGVDPGGRGGVVPPGVSTDPAGESADMSLLDAVTGSRYRGSGRRTRTGA